MTKYGFKGKYCTLCDSVWEMTASAGTVGIEVKHPDFPSYGLERQYCSTCAQSPPTPEATPVTLAQERHKNLLQRIADENQDLLNKNDENFNKNNSNEDH